MKKILILISIVLCSLTACDIVDFGKSLFYNDIDPYAASLCRLEVTLDYPEGAESCEGVAVQAEDINLGSRYSALTDAAGKAVLDLPVGLYRFSVSEIRDEDIFNGTMDNYSVKGAMQTGVLAGYAVVDVKCTLFDGSYHEVDSSELAFKLAGSMAFKDAMAKAAPVLMEPIMKIAVTVPDDYLGTVIGDINSRRGVIRDQENRNGATQINAHVPLASMFGYATDLRSKTQGRGQYVMEPSHYAQVPKSIADAIGKK